MFGDPFSASGNARCSAMAARCWFWSSPWPWRIWTCVLLGGGAIAMASCAHARSAAAPPRQLARLAIYYGWPSVLNGARGIEEAIAGFQAYDVLVLGAGLQRRDHPDHRRTRDIVRALAAHAVEVYGYLALGQQTALTERELARSIKAWRRMGVGGIFFDEAGYDFGNDRRRQNVAFRLTHAQGLRVFANAHDPRDLFDDHHRPGRNPDAEPVQLVGGDAYLYESFGIIAGRPEDAALRQLKLGRLAPARDRGIRVFAVTTSPAPGWFDADLWREAIAEALRAELSGLGFGEADYAASDGRMPWRRR